MRRSQTRLDPLKVTSLLKGPTIGKHADGGGLYLVIKADGSAKWAFIFRWKEHRGRPGAGRLREMGQGSTSAVSLKVARARAASARALVADRIDPIAARKLDANLPTFG